ncbi:MAG TPA: gephyrin-like molybdotransferase Glp [Thermomicrobiales bacterium]|nr:gephyrin-like molybdotransferase Glp [Thermomicrobiales bacterium]
MNDAGDDLDRMLAPDEARGIVLANVRPLEPEVVPIDVAGERYLVDGLIADVSLPPFPAATMDGFAVIHNDPAPSRTILGAGFAGDSPSVTVTPGAAAPIMTGAPVPAGADAVVPVENTARGDGFVEIRQARVSSGENIRPIGADLRQGDLLVPAGTRLGPAEIGLLASLGHAQVRVGRVPRVAVISTGNELVAPDARPGPGQIRDSNRFSLAVAARRAGAEVVVNRHILDDDGALREGIAAAVELADVVVTSGGVSMGDRDLVKALLGDMATVHFRRLFMKPGKPLNFATAGETLLFGLPGNPVSCLVGFHMFVRPALQVMQHAPPDPNPAVPVTIAHDIAPGDRIEYQRAVVYAGADGRLRARNTGNQISARLMSFVGSNAYLIVPPATEIYRSGAQLSAILLGPPAPAPDDRNR